MYPNPDMLYTYLDFRYSQATKRVTCYERVAVVCVFYHRICHLAIDPQEVKKVAFKAREILPNWPMVVN